MLDLSKGEATALLCETSKDRRGTCGNCERILLCTITRREHINNLYSAKNKLKTYIGPETPDVGEEK